MTVILTSPAFNKQVGDEYTGPEEAWLLAQGYARQEGYKGPGVASTGPAAQPPAKDVTLAVNRESTDIDSDTGEAEDYTFKQKASPSHKVPDVDDQEVVVKTAGDDDQPTWPGGEDKGEVNRADEAAPVVEQVADEHKVRAYDAEGNPVTAEEGADEDAFDDAATEETEDTPEAAPGTEATTENA